MNISNTVSKLPHRSPATNTLTDPSTSLSPSHFHTRCRSNDRTPPPHNHLLPGIATCCATERDSVPIESDKGNETRRGRRITRSPSSDEFSEGAAGDSASNGKKRRRRRQNVSPSRDSDSSQCDNEGSRQDSPTHTTKRRRTMDVNRDGLGHVIVNYDDTEKEKEKSLIEDSERSGSRLIARYRRMSEKASMEVRKGNFSELVEAKKDRAAVLDVNLHEEGDGDDDGSSFSSIALSVEKETATYDKVFLGWASAEREEWGVGMRNREEIAGRKAEGRSWLRAKEN